MYAIACYLNVCWSHLWSPYIKVVKYHTLRPPKATVRRESSPPLRGHLCVLIFVFSDHFLLQNERWTLSVIYTYPIFQAPIFGRGSKCKMVPYSLKNIWIWLYEVITLWPIFLKAMQFSGTPKMLRVPKLKKYALIKKNPRTWDFLFIFYYMYAKF